MMMGWRRSQAEELHLEDLGGHLARVAEGVASKGGLGLWWQFPNRQLQSFQRATVNACNGVQLSIYPSVGS